MGEKARFCTPCFPLDPDTLGVGVLAICPEVVEGVTPRQFSAGERLAIRSQNTPKVTILVTGAVREEVMIHDGRRKIMGFMFAGDGLEEVPEISGLSFMAAKSGVYYELTETALRHCRRDKASVEDWKRMQRERRLSAYGKHILLLGRYTAGERVAAFLDELVLRIGRDCADGVDLLLPMGREDIADYLGLKAETVSRQLGRLKASGVLELIKPGHLLIKDRDRLLELVPSVKLN